MSILNAEVEFARTLSTLVGKPFQEEVCRFLRRSVRDFQHVPAQPQGDGGIDGYSHDQTVAYFCYGPDDTQNLTPKALAKKVIKKFRDDLRRLCEVKAKGRNNLVHASNNALPTIMGMGKRFQTVRLIVSVLNSHEVLGPLTDAFNECRQASLCAFVEPSAGMTIWGPAELATEGVVDDATVLRLQHRDVVNRLDALFQSTPLPKVPIVTSDFDAKFDWIDSHSPPDSPGTGDLRSHFMARWLVAIAVEDDLANNAPAHHQVLARLREDVVVDADLESRTLPGAAALIKTMRATLKERLRDAFDGLLPPETIGKLVDGEVGLLIGECPVNWIASS